MAKTKQGVNRNYNKQETKYNPQQRLKTGKKQQTGTKKKLN